MDKVFQYLESLEPESRNSSDTEDQDGELTIKGQESCMTAGEAFSNSKWHMRALGIPKKALSKVRTSTEHLLFLLFAEVHIELMLRKTPKARAYSITKSFVEDLAVEAESEREILHITGAFLRIYLEYIVVRVLEKIDNVSSHREGISPDAALEDIMANTLPEVFDGGFAQPNVKRFLSGSRALRLFISNLRDTIFPDFISEARRYLLEALPVDGVESNSAVPLGFEEERRLLSILRELQACLGEASSFKVEKFGGKGVLDRLKLAVEKSTGSKWDWWPLRPPPSTSPGTEHSHALISWRCKCGMLRREAIPHAHAEKLAELAHKYPVRQLNPDAIALDRLANPTTPSGSSSKGSSSSTGMDSQSIGNSASAGDSGAHVSTAPSSTGSVIVTLGQDTPAFVFLLFQKSSRYVLTSMEVTRKNALEFFLDLAIRYRAERGFFRRVFSIFVYSHCEFAKVRQSISFSPPGFPE